MREPVTFETRLTAAFERYAEGAPVDVEPIEVARLAMYGDARPRAGIRWRDLGTPAWHYAAVLALLLLALAGAVIIARALIHDPLPTVQGEFTRTGPLTTEGSRQAVQLADGRVLLIGIGSVPNTGAEFGLVEIYDPVTDRVERLAGEPVLRHWGGQGVVRLADGRVLLTGGRAVEADGGSDNPAPTEIVDPATGSVTTVGQMVHPRYGHTATLLQDGRVLIAGGDVGGDITKQNPPAELFDPATGTFRAIDPLQHARLYHRASLLNDGRVLLTGGLGDGEIVQAETFDPESETFSAIGDRRQGRADHSSTLLDDGRVLLVGGSGINEQGFISDGTLASAELFDPATNSFSETGALITERSQHAAVPLEDGRVLIAGGYNLEGSPSTTELFDPGTGQFVRGADTLDRVGSATAALLPDGQVFVIGDRGLPELFDPAPVGAAAMMPGPRGDLAGTVSAIEPPGAERYAHTATLLPDGRVLVVGAETGDGTPLDTAEVYDPRTGHWSATGSLHEARAFHTAALLPDGRVLVVGGHVLVTEADGSSTYRPIDSAEVYDPTTGAFSAVGSMTYARSGSSMCCGQVDHFPAMVLPDGRVLLTGGTTDKPGLDLFDPRTNTFIGVPTFCQGDNVVLPDDRVLLACGPGYVFDPSSGQVEALRDFAARQQLGTQLPDGRLLFTDSLGSTPVLFDQANVVPGDQLPWSAVSTASFNQVLWERFDGRPSVQTLTPLPDGRIVVFALRADDTNHPLRRGFTTVFDPRLVTFEEVASPTGRYANTATTLQDGRILFVGKPIRSPDRTDPQPPVAELLDLGLGR